MNTSRDLDRALDRLAEAMGSYAMARVEQALGMERDRHDADIAELRGDIAELGRHVTTLAEICNRHALVTAELTGASVPIYCLQGHEHADAGEAVDCNRDHADPGHSVKVTP